MKKRMKSLVIMFMATLLLTMNGLHVMAQENTEDELLAEFWEKKEKGFEIYELTDENGKLIAYYEPYSETNPNLNEGIMLAYVSSINWEVQPGLYTWGENRYTLWEGMKIQVNISQSRIGLSYLTFHNTATGKSLRFTQTAVTNGWNGTITLVDVSGVFSFGIENASSNTIRYTGTYSL